jgi:hypothetical protein
MGGSGHIDYTYGYGYLYGQQGGGDALTSQYRAAPTAPYTIVARMQMDPSGLIDQLSNGSSAGLATSAGFFIGWRDSGGKYLELLLGAASSIAGFCEIVKWNSATSVNSSFSEVSQTSVVALLTQGALWFKINNDNAGNLTISISIDGNHWAVYYTTTITNFLADADNVTWGSYNNGTGITVCLFDWTVS